MTHPPMDDDPLAARLRAALHSEADMVNPSDDGLSNIRAAIDSSRPWWRHPAALAVAAAVVLGLVVGGGFALLADGDNGGTVVAGQTSSSPATSAASSSETPTPDDTSATPVPVEGDVYVYYVMNDGDGLRLYREQRPNPGMDPATAALSAMFTEAPTDPEYSSLWSNNSQRSFAIEGDTATVDLAVFPALGARAEKVAVQQLVYTVTANDKNVTKVRLLVAGETPSTRRIDLSEPVTRAPMVDVQGLIWLLTPTQGRAVSSPVSIAGYGTAFEGTISWEVRKDGAAGAKVAEGFTSGGSNGEFAEFSDSVDLEPGSYEIRAFESSAKDGSPIHVDTKTFTVQ